MLGMGSIQVDRYPDRARSEQVGYALGNTESHEGAGCESVVSMALSL